MADINKIKVGGVTYDIIGGAVTSVAGKTGAVTLDKNDVGLGNVENKSSSAILGEMTSGDVTSALGYTPMDNSLKGANNGVAELDSTGKVPSSQLPSYVDDVLEYASKSNFPSSGEAGKIYIAKDTNKTYRWSGSAYVEISESLALGTTSSTAYRGDYGNAAYTHAVTNKGSAYASGLYKITTNSEGHVTAAAAVEKADITALGIPSTNTTYTFDGTYNASTNKAATVSTVTNAINALDGNLNSTTPAASKTLTAFSETNGVVSATFGNISITKSQVSDFPTLGAAAAKGVTDNSSSTAVTSSDTNLITGRTLYYAGYMKLTGNQTISGVKTFEEAVYSGGSFRRKADNNFNIQSTNMNNGLTDTLDVYYSGFADKNDQTAASVGVFAGTNGTVSGYLCGTNYKTDGTLVRNILNVGVNKDGSMYYSVTSPTAFRGAIGLSWKEEESGGTEFTSVTTNDKYVWNHKANDSVVVKLTGNQTIAGDKTFSSPVYCSGGSFRRKSSDALNIKSTSMTNGLSSPLDAFYAAFADKNDQSASYIGMLAETTGSVGTYIAATNYKTDGTTKVSNTITVGVRKDGTAFYNIADPAAFRSALDLTNKTAASGGTDISTVTTGDKYTWNHKADDSAVVKLTGDQTITGFKKFTTSMGLTTATNATSGNKYIYFRNKSGTNHSFIYSGCGDPDKITDVSLAFRLYSPKATPDTLTSDGHFENFALPNPDVGRNSNAYWNIWTDKTLNVATAASGGTTASLVTTGEKYTWNSKANGIQSDTVTVTTSASGNASLGDNYKSSGGRVVLRVYPDSGEADVICYPITVRGNAGYVRVEDWSGNVKANTTIKLVVKYIQT